MRRVLGLMASRRVREDERAKLRKLVTAASKYYEVKITDGTYRALGKPRSVTRLPKGPSGGVVQIANDVVVGLCNAVCFMTDPGDSRGDSPENRALFRVCDVWNATVLVNVGSAQEWLDREARRASEWNTGDEQRYRDWKRILESHPGNENRDGGKTIHLDPHQKKIALIAHDRKKPDMFYFVAKYRDKLAQFSRIIATGHTGTEVERFLLEKGASSRILRFESGPVGGDVQIAHQVVSHRCDHVIFFIDPLSPHPHFEDIRLLVRTCMLKEVQGVTLRTNLISASSWIESI